MLLITSVFRSPLRPSPLISFNPQYSNWLQWAAGLQTTFKSSYRIIETSHFYEGRTESHEQLFFFACELGTADEGECGGRWNQLLYYP